MMMLRGAFVLFASMGVLQACSVLTNFAELSSGTAADASAEATASDPHDAEGESTIATCEVGAPYASVVLADHPAAYWRLGEVSGPNAKDELAVHDGTYRGGVQLGVTGALACESNGAARFSGTASFIELGDVFDFAGNAFSIEMWVAPDPLTSNGRYEERYMVSKFDGTAVTGYHVYISSAWVDSTGKSRPAAIGFDICSARDSCGSVGIPFFPTSFAHVVFVFDSQSQVIYADGVERARLPSTHAPVDNTVPFNIGGEASKAGFFPGVLDEVAVYDYALPVERVQAHFRRAR
jgi:hypothetical protein